MKSGGLLLTGTGQCIAATIFIFACCPLIYVIRSQREPAGNSAQQPNRAPNQANISRTSVTQTRVRGAAPDKRSFDFGTGRDSGHRAFTPTHFQMRLARLPEVTDDEIRSQEAIETSRPAVATPIDLSHQRVSSVAERSAIRSGIGERSATIQRESSDRSKSKTNEGSSSTLMTPLEVIADIDRSALSINSSVIDAAVTRAEREIQRAFSLADKGAIYSARSQLELSLRAIADVLDIQCQTHAHKECLERGLLALQEAADFGAIGSKPGAVEFAVAKHRSAILTKSERNHISTDDAMRRYFAFADDHLAAAAGGLPAASHAIYGLGKLALAQSKQADRLERFQILRAMVLFQTALHVNDGNYAAANELGVLLARDGRLNEARYALQLSIAAQPLPETWHNLSVVHERLGEIEQAQRSKIEWQRIRQASQQTNPAMVTASNGSSVYWVDKTTFERASIGSFGGGGALR